jgi:alanyl-tRNA synthetase
MTERLYLLDSMTSAFDATVTACEPAKNGYLIELDKSAFFPNKGGQPCDVGTLSDAAVLDVNEQGERLMHLCDRALPIGATVHGELDFARRFDIMQQHTGEHLLSYCAWHLFGAQNVGFHCALSYATLDLDKPVGHEGILEIETLANRLAAENAAVRATIYETEADLSGIPLRKHAEGLTAPIRIVTIEGSDACTCCAPHVRRTGEIGQLKIVEAIPYKGGTRCTFLCGMRALRHAQTMQDTVSAIALRFSTSREQAEAAVIRQGEELSETKRALRQAYAALDEYLAKALVAEAEDVKGTKLIVKLLEGVDAKRLRPLAGATMTDRALTVLFSDTGERVSYLLASNGIKADIGMLIAAVNTALSGSGGGRGTLAQGSAKKPAGLTETVESLRTYFKNVLLHG